MCIPGLCGNNQGAAQQELRAYARPDLTRHLEHLVTHGTIFIGHHN